MSDRKWICTQLTTASLEVANKMYMVDGIAFTIKDGQVAEFYNEALEEIINGN